MLFLCRSLPHPSLLRNWLFFILAWLVGVLERFACNASFLCGPVGGAISVLQASRSLGGRPTLGMAIREIGTEDVSQAPHQTPENVTVWGTNFGSNQTGWQAQVDEQILRLSGRHYRTLVLIGPLVNVCRYVVS